MRRASHYPRPSTAVLRFQTPPDVWAEVMRHLGSMDEVARLLQFPSALEAELLAAERRTHRRGARRLLALAARLLPFLRRRPTNAGGVL